MLNMVASSYEVDFLRNSYRKCNALKPLATQHADYIEFIISYIVHSYGLHAISFHSTLFH